MLTILRDHSGRVRGLSLGVRRNTHWTTALVLTRDGVAVRLLGFRTLRLMRRAD